MLTGPMTARRSNAKTAYGLMSDIHAYILEEPKRVCMGYWIVRGHEVIVDIFDVEGPAEGHMCGWPSLQREAAAARAALNGSQEVEDGK